MELKKIQDKLNVLVEKNDTKRQAIQKDLSNTKEKLIKVNEGLLLALNSCDIQTHNNLLADKEDLENNIKFYNEYLNNFDSLPVITKDETIELLKDIETCINDTVQKPYKETLKELEKILNTAEHYLDFFDNAKALNTAIKNYSKLNLAELNCDERKVFHHIQTNINKVLKLANGDTSYSSPLEKMV